MPEGFRVGFVSFNDLARDVLLVFCDSGLKFGPTTRKMLANCSELLRRAAEADRFTGKSGTALDIVAPAGLKAGRLIVVGIGKPNERKADDMITLGGAAMGRIPSRASAATIVAELPNGAIKPDQAAELALGAQLRAYSFERYKTKRKDGERPAGKIKLDIAVADVGTARKAFLPCQALAQGVNAARDLVNEPANILYPEEFARRATALRKNGVAVEVLDEKAMAKLHMNALLGVSQGSAHGGRVVIMRWNGRKKNDAPVAFIGKGVCFDTGGISIKPASNMEDMKGDMAGAACVVGLMHVLAARKARVNAVGLIGLVENMPDGKAQRPGDIVTSMSGQTIEIINTDAEGRLVLADVLWYAATKIKPKPKFLIDLATLTGAIVVALGHEHAGLFSNDDELASRLLKSGEIAGERLWRMPLAPDYDKMIDSKFADVKNTGGRWAGAITAAQFLQRFIDKLPWAHLDIAGTGMSSPQTDINRSWASGFGVRLLDRFVKDYCE